MYVETLTFLFTDIEGSTALLGRLGDDDYAQLLAGHHALVRSALAAYGGREVDTQGDAFFAVFSSPRGCVAAVLAMQRTLAAYAWPGGERVRVRMGIHCGEAARAATGVVGLEVHRAARVAAVAHGGQVLVSEAAAVLVRDGLPMGTALADLGVHRLKDLGRPERIFQLHAAGLPTEFPPLRSLGNPALPNNLPAQLSSFIGRDREVSEVRALVESSRLVTLTGAGGCGKTRLGLQVAAELLDGSGDGVWLAELAAVTDQDAVPAAISRALRLTGQPGRAPLEALLDALAPQDVLIVVDNCEHVIGGCAKTADAIVRRCPRVHLLATSREPLGVGGETLYRVPSLSLPGTGDPGSPARGSSDAVALFADRARANGLALDVDEQAGPLAVSVCRRLDGMPLAIELAAARLRSMSLSELHDRLDQRFRLLTGGSRTAPERQQTLRATVGWSYSLLTGTEQLLLARLSAFAGSFDLAAAEAVCGSGDVDVLEVAGLLGSLVDKSLVVAEPAGETLRYRLLETIRLFGAERLLSRALGARCGAHFFAGEPETGLRFGQESVERARRLGDDVLLAWSLLMYLMPLDAIDPARSGQLYAEAIACTERSGDHFTNSILHGRAGVAALAARDVPAARAHLDAAAQAAQQIGWESTNLPTVLGRVLREERDLDGAWSTFEDALRISRRNGLNIGMAGAISGLACLAGDAGNWDRAAALHGVAQAFQDRSGNPWQEPDAHYRRDSLDQARAHLGDEQLDRAYDQGMALSQEKALDLALLKTGPA